MRRSPDETAKTERAGGTTPGPSHADIRRAGCSTGKRTHHCTGHQQGSGRLRSTDETGDPGLPETVTIEQASRRPGTSHLLRRIAASFAPAADPARPDALARVGSAGEREVDGWVPSIKAAGRATQPATH